MNGWRCSYCDFAWFIKENVDAGNCPKCDLDGAVYQGKIKDFRLFKQSSHTTAAPRFKCLDRFKLGL